MYNYRNPSLFNALARVFGVAEPDANGENYYVDCPFCGDRRHRLCIHYTWGTYRPGSTFLNLGKITCFNEECMAVPGRRQELFDMLFPVDGTRGMKRRISLPKGGRTFKAFRSTETKVEMPEGDYIPVNKLKAHDEARLYLESRGFDCDRLWNERRVSYCQLSPGARPNISDRLVIPYFAPPPSWDKSADQAQPELLGYIARRPGEDQPYQRGFETRKYLLPVGFSKSHFLYGLERAMGTAGPVVICEGVTDVWRVGDTGVALTGKTMSQEQERLLMSRFKGRPLVVLLDSDAQEEAAEIRERLMQGRAFSKDAGPVLLVAPPEGRKDLGECSEEEVDELLDGLGDTLGAASKGTVEVEQLRYPDLELRACRNAEEAKEPEAKAGA